MIIPEKIKVKLTKDEFVCFNQIISTMVSGFKDTVSNDERDIMCQIHLTKLYQKTAKTLISVRTKYDLDLKTETACALFNHLRSFPLRNLGAFENNIIHKMIIQIHREVLA